MPSVFTIEGLSAAQLAQLSDSPVVHYPPYGGPLAPHGSYNVGSTRPPTLVFNAERLAAEPPLVRWPERGPITAYGAEYAPLLMMQPYVNLGDTENNTLKTRWKRFGIASVIALVGLTASLGVGLTTGKRANRRRGV